MDEQTFEWDEAKNRENQAKHGVSFQEATYAFNDPDCLINYDHAHSEFEHRYVCMGLDKAKTNILTVRFTYRKGRIRIIGAGYWRSGRRVYVKERSI